MFRGANSPRCQQRSAPSHSLMSRIPASHAIPRMGDTALSTGGAGIHAGIVPAWLKTFRAVAGLSWRRESR